MSAQVRKPWGGDYFSGLEATTFLFTPYCWLGNQATRVENVLESAPGSSSTDQKAESSVATLWKVGGLHHIR